MGDMMNNIVPKKISFKDLILNYLIKEINKSEKSKKGDLSSSIYHDNYLKKRSMCK